MADYTIELRRYIDSFSYGSSLSRKEQMDIGRKHLFDFEYSSSMKITGKPLNSIL